MNSNNEISHDINCGKIKLTTNDFKGNEKSTDGSVTIQSIPWFAISLMNWNIMSLFRNLRVSETNKKLNFKLSCNENSANTMWNCEADIEIHVNKLHGKRRGNFKKMKVISEKKVFDFKNKSMEGTLVANEKVDDIESLLEKKQFEIEAKLKLTRIYGYRKRKIIDYSIEHPRFSNGIIVVDGSEFHVNKQILAMHSKYFYNMFFGNFTEKNSKSVEIPGVSYDDFVIFLDFVHPTGRKMEVEFVENLMELADLFLADRIMDYCEEFLMTTEVWDVGKKMLLAEKFSLSELMASIDSFGFLERSNFQNHCLNSFKTTKSLLELKKSNNFFDISDEIKSCLLERAVQLNKQRALRFF
ncbi:hypothetical protein GCK72_014380 [Caenorhabditis remanei]|uniref:BTB domain-containing protein n=1 Tax=Caenorhabditis remanei TaxID=31234 RepID=A0A6A5GTX2_CAERE|nr:hypothetical protein GCK72_014380 [Caenorhabditis remanei]KAF1757923.1 hypothetical protein GCK72_014380 [Caenorhabditis remanei]